jgi:hypothetical protein
MMGHDTVERRRRTRPWRPSGTAVQYSVPELQEPRDDLDAPGYDATVWLAHPLQAFPVEDAKPADRSHDDNYY